MYDEINFDQIVMDTAMRDHLGYNVPDNKTLLNMKGKVKRMEGVVPGASKKPAKNRAADPKVVVTEKVEKKKKATPLAACLLKLVPLMRTAKQPIGDISQEEVSEAGVEDVFEDIDGYIPKCSPTCKTATLPTFLLVDEQTPTMAQSSSSSGQNAEINRNVDEPKVAKMATEAAPKTIARRVKHKTNRQKSLNRWVGAIAEAELIMGWPVIIPNKEPRLQADLSLDDSEEMDEERSVHSLEG